MGAATGFGTTSVVQHKGKHEPFAFGNCKSSTLYTSVQVFNEPQTSRNAGAVSEAFLGVVYGEREMNDSVDVKRHIT